MDHTDSNDQRPLAAKDTVADSYDIVGRLLSGTGLVLASRAELDVPPVPGIYAICIDHPNTLPSPFAAYLLQKETTLIYVGKASESLQARLVEQDLRHRQPASFFRSIGAIGGFRPPPGSLAGKKNQNNYTFSTDDTTSIITWINTHLLVRWVTMRARDVQQYERMAIERLRPLLNIANNPDKLPELVALRAQCRAIARSRNSLTKTTPRHEKLAMAPEVGTLADNQRAGCDSTKDTMNIERAIERLMHAIALHNQRIVGVLHGLTHVVPLFLLNKHHIVGWCRRQRWHATR